MRLARGAWAGAVALIYLFLLAPLLVVLVMSFDTKPYLAFPPSGFSLRPYAAVLHNAAFLRAFAASVTVGLVTALLALAAGVLAALALARRRFRGREAVNALFLAPLLVPHIVLAMGILLVLARLGLLDTYPGLVLAHVGITIPYVIRTTMLSLDAVETACEEAARVHGASAFTTFRRVTLPLAAPGLIAGGVIAFLISFDEAVISLFVVATRVTILPVEIFRYVENRTDPEIAALSVLLILVSVALMLLVERVVGLRRALRA